MSHSILYVDVWQHVEEQFEWLDFLFDFENFTSRNCLEHTGTYFVFKIVTSLAGCLLKTFVGRIRSFYSGSIIGNFEFPLALNIFSMAMCSELQIVNKHRPRLLMSIYRDKRCSVKRNQKRPNSEMTGHQARKITCKIRTLKALISDDSYPANSDAAVS